MTQDSPQKGGRAPAMRLEECTHGAKTQTEAFYRMASSKGKRAARFPRRRVLCDFRRLFPTHPLHSVFQECLVLGESVRFLVVAQCDRCDARFRVLDDPHL